MTISSSLRVRLLPLLAVVLCARLSGAELFQPVLDKADLDAAAFSEWMDGKETVIGPDRRREGPAWVVWTRDSQAGWYGQEFGDGKIPGARHLRLGFTKPIAVGTILADAETISVLKSGAAYPGNLGDDSQWLPLARLGEGGLASTVDGGELATWVVPPGTSTRALRLTHVAKANDRRYNGRIAAVWLLADRFDNVAGQAVATASANSEAAGKIIDARDNGHSNAWDNGGDGQELPISGEHPTWVMLSWKQPRTLAGLALLGAGAAKAEVQYCTAPVDQHPTLAPESAWTTIVPATGVDPLYPRALGLSPLPFPKPVTTRGVRVRFVVPYDDQHTHPHLNGITHGGKRMWLSEVFAFAPLGDKPLTAPAPARTADDHPPIPLRFHLDKPGLVTLVIEDAQGNRIRNLVSETRFPAGDCTAWWDGLDDRERDYEAAEHHVYRIPGKLVAPGTYRVRGLVRDDVSLTYEFSFYTHGTPAWETADSTGGWLANHTPPQACAFVPAGMTGDGKECMLLGSPVTEGGSGLAWVDLDGRKLHGVGWIGGNWSGAARLAVDRGAKRLPGYYAYVGSAQENELRLTGMRVSGGDGAILHWHFAAPADSELNGIAVRDGLIVCSLPKLNTLMFVQAADGRILTQLPCADPRGVAFDAQGRLWVLSGTRLLRADLPADFAERFTGAPVERASWVASASSGDAAPAIDGKGDTRWGTGHPQQKGDWFQLDLGRAQKIARVSLTCKGSDGDFPRGVELYASADGATWGKALVSAAGSGAVTDLTLPAGTSARFLKLVSTGSDANNWWSIAELGVFGPATGYPELGGKAVVSGLEDPVDLCVEGQQIYLSDRGTSQQVKVFSLDGAPLRTVGRPGRPGVGPYDPLHMNNPAGLAIDARGRLWVAEYENQPKRISVWKPDGSLDRAYYGPARYGCGGTLDPADKSRLFFEGMEFSLDWKTGGDALRSVIWRGGLDLGGGQPERMEHVGGHDYLTNTYDSNPTGGADVAGIWSLEGGIAKPIAAAGRARSWPSVAEHFARLDRFSVRWTGKVVPTVTGQVVFHTISDDGVRLWVDGKPLIDNWKGHGPTEDHGSATLTAGKPVDIRLEWYQGSGGAAIHLLWSATGLAKGVIPASQLIATGATHPGGLRGDYHFGENFDRAAFSRIDPTIDLDLPAGGVIEIPGTGAAAAAYRARLPAGADFERDALFFAWSDRNHDGKVDAEEVTFHRDEVGAVTVQPDLSLATSTGLVAKPTGFDASGVPLYDAGTATAVVPGGRIANTSGGGNTMLCPDGWTVMTIPPAPFPQQSSMSGVKDGVVRWTYPSLWPGLHPSHSAPVPDRPGMLIGTTRVLGAPFKPSASDAGWCWAINGNQGVIYLFTSDGLFIATLFHDARQASTWAMPTATRGMHLEDSSIGQENFWPSLTQTADGRVYVVTNSAIIQVGGLETITRLPAVEFAVGAEQLAKA
ncbi:MAG: discoidin domain-containing protein, partial [Planctomycetes bacterium]|nr:discoidin domain-containing protein [Planctomycetota bacterium]